MSKEFNYARAHKQFVSKEFKKVYPLVKEAYDRTRSVVHELGQAQNLSLIGQTSQLTKLFDAIPAETLAWASEVIYYYGHLAPSSDPLPESQEGGLYWKFQMLAKDSLINRAGVVETRIKTERKMKDMLNKFNDHKEGTEYDHEEGVEILTPLISKESKGLFVVERIQDVNHKPDVFVISGRHMSLSTGMYLDPNVAPCARCHQDYKDHTHETVMILKLLVDPKENDEKINPVIKKLGDLAKERNIKFDGFAFTKGF